MFKQGRRFDSFIRGTIITCSLFFSGQTMAQTKLQDCYSSFNGDTLTIGNDAIERKYICRSGELLTYSVTDKIHRNNWQAMNLVPAFNIPSLKPGKDKSAFSSQIISATKQTAAHLEATFTIAYNELQIKKVFRIYPGCAAIACDYFMKGNAAAWQQSSIQSNDIKNLESVTAAKDGEASVIITDRLSLPGRHWKIKAVEFFDATDQNNNLVQEYNRMAYTQEMRLRGNIAFMEEANTGNGLFWLKESPVSSVQLDYAGFDFAMKMGDFKITGLGISAKDISADEWIRCYSVVMGVYAGGEQGGAFALRTYQDASMPAGIIANNMILLNTWGDRGQDKNINEKMVLEELKNGAALGITHFQMDDGWQSGKSANSAFSGGTFKDIWHKPGYWLPDSTKFPEGFRNVMKSAAEKKIIISTWFNPSVDSSFKYWDKDAAVLIDQYKTYGIHTWKIDGVRIADKQADINFRKMLDTVVARTNGEAVFNLDVTAGRRFGYHYFYEYGNLFLENRYTDWSNYYPHFTLRNLWMLSRYMPPQRLQIEFLNKWRNTDKYAAGDSLSPSHYSFDYLFAISMPAQSLAWMEARNLPPAGYAIAPLIKKYKAYWNGWHRGMIFPVGDEPSGYSWTGFQSFIPGNTKEGFVLVFREANENKRSSMELKQLEKGDYTFTLLAGSGKSFTTVLNASQSVSFELDDKRSFALFRYQKK